MAAQSSSASMAYWVTASRRLTWSGSNVLFRDSIDDVEYIAQLIVDFIDHRLQHIPVQIEILADVGFDDRHETLAAVADFQGIDNNIGQVDDSGFKKIV